MKAKLRYNFIETTIFMIALAVFQIFANQNWLRNYFNKANGFGILELIGMFILGWAIILGIMDFSTYLTYPHKKRKDR